MRLLNINDHGFREFHGENIPPYLIASHRWTDDETTFKDVLKRRNKDSAGWRKIEGFCERAKKDNELLKSFENATCCEWIWIDTACIDKRSSAEVSESINSMFTWYNGAQECHAYLADVKPFPANQQLSEVLDDFKHSEWWKRGWTLQELLAPRAVVFFTQTWQIIGHKCADCDAQQSCEGAGPLLNAVIAEITGIPEEVLRDYERSKAISVEEKMKWQVGRRTTRIEDRAYCLLGLFDVHMPLLYGEGEKAMLRLERTVFEELERPWRSQLRLNFNDLAQNNESSHLTSRWLRSGRPLTIMRQSDVEGEVLCICGYADDDGWLVACDICQYWQHAICYYPGEDSEPALSADQEHRCRQCCPRELDVAAAQARQRKKRVVEINFIGHAERSERYGFQQKRRVSDSSSEGLALVKHPRAQKTGPFVPSASQETFNPSRPSRNFSPKDSDDDLRDPARKEESVSKPQLETRTGSEDEAPLLQFRRRRTSPEEIEAGADRSGDQAKMTGVTAAVADPTLQPCDSNSLTGAMDSFPGSDVWLPNEHPALPEWDNSLYAPDFMPHWTSAPSDDFQNAVFGPTTSGSSYDAASHFDEPWFPPTNDPMLWLAHSDDPGQNFTEPAFSMPAPTPHPELSSSATNFDLVWPASDSNAFPGLNSPYNSSADVFAPLRPSTKRGGRCPLESCGRKVDDLEIHLQGHRIFDRPEKCPIPTCEYHSKGFARKYDKDRHTLTHYKGTMVCGFCPGSGSAAERSFNRVDVFKRHLTSVHGVEQVAPNSRHGKSSSKRKSLQSSGSEEGSCSLCSQSFAGPQALYEHLDDCVLRNVRHQNFPEHSESYTCQHTECAATGVAFRYPKDLRRHMNVKHGEGEVQMYTCPAEGCGKKFVTKSHMLRHQRVMHGAQIKRRG